MIQIIAGKKGSGKTKRLIDMTNNAVKTSSGNVVFLDKNDSYMYEVDRAVRFVNVEEHFRAGNAVFFDSLEKYAQKHDVTFVLSVSADPEALPDFCKGYII